jgi:hypothetical protein
MPITGQWMRASDELLLPISEDTALRLLGHLPMKRQNWVPGDDEPIVVTTVGMRRADRKPI